MKPMQDFFLWLLNQLPTFLASEPIIYFVGVILGFYVIVFLRKLLNVSR